MDTNENALIFSSDVQARHFHRIKEIYEPNVKSIISFLVYRIMKFRTWLEMQSVRIDRFFNILNEMHNKIEKRHSVCNCFVILTPYHISDENSLLRLDLSNTKSQVKL